MESGIGICKWTWSYNIPGCFVGSRCERDNEVRCGPHACARIYAERKELMKWQCPDAGATNEPLWREGTVEKVLGEAGWQACFDTLHPGEMEGFSFFFPILTNWERASHCEETQRQCFFHTKEILKFRLELLRVRTVQGVWLWFTAGVSQSPTRGIVKLVENHVCHFVQCIFWFTAPCGG